MIEEKLEFPDSPEHLVSQDRLDLLEFPEFLVLTVAMELMVCLVSPVLSETQVQEGKIFEKNVNRNSFNSTFYLVILDKLVLKEKKEKLLKLLTPTIKKVKKVNPASMEELEILVFLV